MDSQRLLSRLSQSVSGCWEWTGYRSPDGYGRFDGRQVHRLIFELLRTPIPAGLHLDHLCRNRACANPEHLEPVTLAENNRRAEAATKTHCVHGHPFDERNTYQRTAKCDGRRQCRTCNAMAVRRYKQRQHGLAA